LQQQPENILSISRIMSTDTHHNQLSSSSTTTTTTTTTTTSTTKDLCTSQILVPSLNLQSSQDPTPIENDLFVETKEHTIPGYLFTFEEDRLIKRTLFTLLIQRELNSLKKSPTLEGIGGTLYIRYLFQRLIAEFPFLREQGPTFWGKVALLSDRLAKLGIDSSTELPQDSKAEHLWYRLEKLSVLFFDSKIQTPASQCQGVEEEDAVSIALLKQISESAAKKSSTSRVATSRQATEFAELLNSFLKNLVNSGTKKESESVP
jgi:hypothetical protein